MTTPQRKIIGQHKGPEKAKELSLRLTAVVNEPFSGDVIPFYDTSTISADARLIFVTTAYVDPVDATSAAGTIYENEGGLLAQIGEIPVDPLFPFGAVGGAISPDGKLVYLAEESATEARIRVFSVSGLQLLNTIPLPNIFPGGFSLVSSLRILKNRFTTATYLTGETAPGQVDLYDLVEGEIVASAVIQGFSNDGGLPFKLHGDIYVSVAATVDAFNAMLTGPSFENIFRLAPVSQLESVLTIPLPGLASTQDSFLRECADAILLAIPVLRANVPGAVVINPPPPFLNATGEPAGIRIFAFDGEDICLVALKTIGNGVQGFSVVAFDPTGRFLSAGAPPPRSPISLDPLINSSTLAALITYRLKLGENCENKLIKSVLSCRNQFVLEEVASDYAPPNVLALQFSRDGNWLISSGGPFGIREQFQFPFPEVALFRVFYEACPPVVRT